MSGQEDFGSLRFVDLAKGIAQGIPDGTVLDTLAS